MKDALLLYDTKVIYQTRFWMLLELPVAFQKWVDALVSVESPRE